jgi:hypothetical protein
MKESFDPDNPFRAGFMILKNPVIVPEKESIYILPVRKSMSKSTSRRTKITSEQPMDVSVNGQDSRSRIITSSRDFSSEIVFKGADVDFQPIHLLGDYILATGNVFILMLSNEILRNMDKKAFNGNGTLMFRSFEAFIEDKYSLNISKYLKDGVSEKQVKKMANAVRKLKVPSTKKSAFAFTGSPLVYLMPFSKKEFPQVVNYNYPTNHDFTSDTQIILSYWESNSDKQRDVKSTLSLDGRPVETSQAIISPNSSTKIRRVNLENILHAIGIRAQKHFSRKRNFAVVDAKQIGVYDLDDVSFMDLLEGDFFRPFLSLTDASIYGTSTPTVGNGSFSFSIALDGKYLGGNLDAMVDVKAKKRTYAVPVNF